MTAAIFIKFLVIGFTAMMWIMLTATMMAGRRLRALSPSRPPSILRDHMHSARHSGVLMLLLVLCIEFIAVRYFGRQYDTLFFVQLGWSILYAFALGASYLANGIRARRFHHYLGWITWISGTIASVLGIFVTLRLHRP